MKDRLKPIEQMENILNHTDELIKEMDQLLEKWSRNEEDFNQLMNYYGSEEWHMDRKSDEDGLLPQDFPRGVLSEDAVHNSFGERKEVSVKMIKVGVASLE